MIGTVFANTIRVHSWSWNYRRRFVFRSVLDLLSNHFLQAHSPTLISFGAIHQNGIWRCRHTAVVIGFDQNRMAMLDPLGRPPDKATANVWMVSGTPIVVAGARYTVDPESEVGILHWIPAGKTDHSAMDHMLNSST